MSVLLVTCPLRECLEGACYTNLGQENRIQNTSFCPKHSSKMLRVLCLHQWIAFIF